MNILVVSSYLPYPLFSGGHVRLYNILKQLSKKHKITLVCEMREHQKKEDLEEVKKFCRDIITVDRGKQWSAKNIIKAASSVYPFLIIGHTKSEMAKKIKNLLEKEKFDIIHVETFYVMQNLPKEVNGIPVVLTEHNIEYLVYERFVKTAPIFLRPFLYFDILKLKYWEKVFWKKATKLVAVSQEEKRIMGRADAQVVQNGVDTDEFKVESAGWRTKFKGERRILFIGDFKWVQNRDSAEWILKEIWPDIKSKMGVKLWVVGRRIPNSIKTLGDESVIFDESASGPTREIFKKADVLLAPIRVGGGTSFKILEAMASGVPVVTTSLGIEGIEAENLKDVIISEDPLELAKSVIDIMENDKIYEKISKNARKLIEEKYNWESIVKKLEDVYEEAIS
ncbi:MAG: glycosyltransferase family 4 protein [Candidatus Levybacteria bacterium]|nr:glycosyltransferase family 4 protein [Candidatus Levybacteria bacterium]